MHAADACIGRWRLMLKRLGRGPRCPPPPPPPEPQPHEKKRAAPRTPKPFLNTPLCSSDNCRSPWLQEGPRSAEASSPPCPGIKLLGSFLNPLAEAAVDKRFCRHTEQTSSLGIEPHPDQRYPLHSCIVRKTYACSRRSPPELQKQYCSAACCASRACDRCRQARVFLICRNKWKSCPEKCSVGSEK